MDGRELLPYGGALERTLSASVGLRCKRAYGLACSLLEHALRALSLHYPTEYRSTPGGWGGPGGLPIRVHTQTHRHTDTHMFTHTHTHTHPHTCSHTKKRTKANT